MVREGRDNGERQSEREIAVTVCPVTCYNVISVFATRSMKHSGCRESWNLSWNVRNREGQGGTEKREGERER